MKALVLVLLAGCVGKPIDDIEIACNADTDCPSDAWCDLRFTADHVCRTNAVGTPPHLVYEGFVDGSGVAPTITVPPKTTSFWKLRLRNDSTSQTDVTMEITGPSCLDAGSLVRKDGELLDAGKTLDAEFDVDPTLPCASPTTVQIQATASHRAFMFTAMISISN